jgi:hypothetical protein
MSWLSKLSFIAVFLATLHTTGASAFSCHTHPDIIDCEDARYCFDGDDAGRLVPFCV